MVTNGEKNLIITRYLNADESSRPSVDGKKNKPTDFDSLEKFKQINIENFEDENFCRISIIHNWSKKWNYWFLWIKVWKR